MVETGIASMSNPALSAFIRDTQRRSRSGSHAIARILEDHTLEHGRAAGARRRRGAAHPGPAPAVSAVRPGPVIAPAHTDWLYHNLTVTGPAAALGPFRDAAAGAGVIPWVLDHDRMEEDFFWCLAAPPGHLRTLSLEGARMLAADLREAAARRHGLALAEVGRSAACPFDLHALLPVPDAMLRLGPDQLQPCWCAPSIAGLAHQITPQRRRHGTSSVSHLETACSWPLVARPLSC